LAIPSVMSDLSVTAASNFPAGTEAPSNADDFFRAIQAILRTTNAKGSDISSAATTDIGAATGEFVDVTGTTTITALGTIAAGIVRTVRFTGALTLTHNATSLILPGAANITTANGDCAIFRSLGSGNWKCVGYFTQSGKPSDASLGVSMINGTLTATVSANALTIAIKTKAGADPSAGDPVLVYFRNVTSATGDYTIVSITAATSFVVSSGSTLGTTSAIASRLWVVGFNDGGTFRLGAINLTTQVAIGDDVIASSTAEGGAGAADSAGVFYTGTAVTSKAMRVLGYVESTQATAGTWATTPSKVQLVSNLYNTLPPSYKLTASAAVTASGTSVDFTSIPSWVTMIIVSLVGISTNGASLPQLQLGDSGGVETTGYLGAGGAIAAASAAAANATSGFIINRADAASVAHGSIMFTLADASTNTWAAHGVIGLSNSTFALIVGGSKALSATLDRVRITTVNGTDTFDAGTINVIYG
jgi:hypothetical protein